MVYFQLGIGYDIVEFIIRSKFEVIIVLQGDFFCCFKLFFGDEFVLDEGLEFFDGFGFEDKLEFVLERTVGV